MSPSARRCAVIGAGGLVGRHLVRQLVASGWDVDAIDRTPVVEPGVRPVVASIADGPPPIEPGTDVVVNLAQSPAYRTWPTGAGELMSVNVAGALHVAEAALAAGARALLHASTGSVYAPSFDPLHETSPVAERDAYSLSKLAAERGLDAFAAATGLRIVLVRPFGVFGPGQTAMLVPAIAGRIGDGRAVTLEPHPEDPGDDGGLRVSLLAGDDAAWCLERIAARSLEATWPPEEACSDGDAALPAGAMRLNLAGPSAVSVRELAEHLGRILGRPPVFETAEAPRRGDLVADISRLDAMIGPSFAPLDDALAAAIGIHA